MSITMIDALMTALLVAGAYLGYRLGIRHCIGRAGVLSTLGLLCELLFGIVLVWNAGPLTHTAFAEAKTLAIGGFLLGNALGLLGFPSWNDH